MQDKFQIAILKRDYILVRSQKTVKSFCFPESPLVAEYGIVFGEFQKHISGEYRQPGRHDFSSPAQIQYPLREIQGHGDIRVLGPEQADEPFLAPGFYLQRVVNHGKSIAI
jgi:hypothetical protein